MNLKLKGKELLSEAANKYLFLQCFNNIDHAINGAREAAEIKPTVENTALLCELEYFYQNNIDFYAEARKASEKIITDENRDLPLFYSLENTNSMFQFYLKEDANRPVLLITDSIDKHMIEQVEFHPKELESLIEVLSNQLKTIKNNELQTV